MTFEMKLKLLTGLKLVWIRSKPIFFSNGQTMAVFQFLWNFPLVSEMFTILVSHLFSDVCWYGIQFARLRFKTVDCVEHLVLCHWGKANKAWDIFMCCVISWLITKSFTYFCNLVLEVVCKLFS